MGKPYSAFASSEISPLPEVPPGHDSHYGASRGWSYASTAFCALLTSVGAAGALYALVQLAFLSSWQEGGGYWAAHALVDAISLLPLALIAAWFARREARAAASIARAALVSVLAFAALMMPFSLLLEPWHRQWDALGLALLQPSDAAQCTFVVVSAMTPWRTLLAQAFELSAIAALGALPGLLAAAWSMTRRPDPATDTAATEAFWQSPTFRALRLPAALVLVMCSSSSDENEVEQDLADLAQRPLVEPEAIAGNPCGNASNVRRYDVSAIHVQMTLNRFGDLDRDAYMYVLDERMPDVRAQEQTELPDRVSLGLRKDAIQPLVLRANLGECLQINFTNRLEDGPASLKVFGLPHTSESAGGEFGFNQPSFAQAGQTVTYNIPIPSDPQAEHAYYFRDGGESRQRVTHGMFGVVVAEPAGSEYLDPETGEPSAGDNWESIIRTPGNEDFREFVLIYHEIGDENFAEIARPDGRTLPVVDELTLTYRPSGRGINYRSEPFGHRLELHLDKSQGYGSYMFGDPATPIPRSYLGEPTKTRLIHGGSEVFHVHHLHGGADRWRRNPGSDPANAIAGGLNKLPVQNVTSTHLDAQAIGPGTSYNLEHECGAGACQQAAGDFLFHCHIGHHYLAGMWSFWRVFDTQQSDLATLPNMSAAPPSVNSAALIGNTYDGRTIVETVTNPDTEITLADWLRQLLPPSGVPFHDEDATVWDWTLNGNVALGEPETLDTWANYVSDSPGVRPEIQFNPENGRYAWPLFRPHLGKRPPFAPNGHSGAPWLGENGSSDRADGLCPSVDVVDIPGRQQRYYPITAINLPIETAPGQVDERGQLFVLSENKELVYDGTMPSEPLAIRSNVGDCTEVLLTSELNDLPSNYNHSKTNMHTHFVQFDPQASDGVITGMSYEQSVRPYRSESRDLVQEAAAGDFTLQLASTEGLRAGIWIGIGLGEGMCALGNAQIPCTEIRRIQSVNGTAITLEEPLSLAHQPGQQVGVEFVRYNWYADVDFGTVFWHDHVDFSNWDHGAFGALIVEPAGSTYHDPVTGDEIRSGAIADIRAPAGARIAHDQTGSFREFMVFQHSLTGGTEGIITEGATFNLRAQPWDTRAGNPAHRFSSVVHGDPITPLPRAYVGDPVIFRHLSLQERVSALRVTGHRFQLERFAEDGAYFDADAIGISERYDLPLAGGAGGPEGRPGDYLYYSTLQRDFVNGAWGILRVHDSQQGNLQPLPGRPMPSGQGLPQIARGAAPDIATGPGDACPDGASLRHYDVRIGNAIIVTSDAPVINGVDGVTYTLDDGSDDTPVVREPLVLRVNEGECLEVSLRNTLAENASLSVGEMLTSPQGSYGSAIGYNPDSTTAPGETRTYRWYADRELGTVTALDMANPIRAAEGAFAGVIVEPAGSEYRDPFTGEQIQTGCVADILTPDGGFREMVALIHDDDAVIGQNRMPYPKDTEGFTSLSFSAQPLLDRLPERSSGLERARAFSSTLHGDPRLVLQGNVGDRARIRVAQPWGEQGHVFGLGGHRFRLDPRLAGSQQVHSHLLLPGFSWDAEIEGGLGGGVGSTGDFFVGDLRMPFVDAGDWAIISVAERDSSAVQPLRTARPLP